MIAIVVVNGKLTDATQTQACWEMLTEKPTKLKSLVYSKQLLINAEMGFCLHAELYNAGWWMAFSRCYWRMALLSLSLQLEKSLLVLWESARWVLLPSPCHFCLWHLFLPPDKTNRPLFPDAIPSDSIGYASHKIKCALTTKGMSTLQ